MSSLPHKISPLMPEDRVLDPLHEKAGALIRQATALLSHGAILEPLRPLLRAMNSYYTNRIEGQHTRPSDIERALLRQVNSDSEIARRQRLAVSHLEAERELEDLWMNRPLTDLYAADAETESPERGDQRSVNLSIAASVSGRQRKVYDQGRGNGGASLRRPCRSSRSWPLHRHDGPRRANGPAVPCKPTSLRIAQVRITAQPRLLFYSVRLASLSLSAALARGRSRYDGVRTKISLYGASSLFGSVAGACMGNERTVPLPSLRMCSVNIVERRMEAFSRRSRVTEPTKGYAFLFT